MTAPVEAPLKHWRYLTDLPAAEAPAWAARGPHRQRVPLHDHDFLEFELVESGEAEHISIHGREHVGPGHLHILHPGQWHGYEEVRSLVLHDIYFPVGLFARELAWMQSDHRLAPIFPMRMPRNDAERRAAPQGVLSMRLDPALFAAVHACCMEIQALIEGAGSRRLAAVLARA